MPRKQQAAQEPAAPGPLYLEVRVGPPGMTKIVSGGFIYDYTIEQQSDRIVVHGIQRLPEPKPEPEPVVEETE